MLNWISSTVNDLKYAFISISGWVVANIPSWIGELAEWFVILAQVCGGLAALFGVLKMVEQFLHKRIGIDIFRNGSKRNTGK
jgi:hypothetical protein